MKQQMKKVIKFCKRTNRTNLSHLEPRIWLQLNLISTNSTRYKKYKNRSCDLNYLVINLNAETCIDNIHFHLSLSIVFIDV